MIKKEELVIKLKIKKMIENVINTNKRIIEKREIINTKVSMKDKVIELVINQILQIMAKKIYKNIIKNIKVKKGGNFIIQIQRIKDKIGVIIQEEIGIIIAKIVGIVLIPAIQIMIMKNEEIETKKIKNQTKEEIEIEQIITEEIKIITAWTVEIVMILVIQIIVIKIGKTIIRNKKFKNQTNPIQIEEQVIIKLKRKTEILILFLQKKAKIINRNLSLNKNLKRKDNNLQSKKI